jgi:hypothetical protein
MNWHSANSDRVYNFLYDYKDHNKVANSIEQKTISAGLFNSHLKRAVNWRYGMADRRPLNTGVVVPKPGGGTQPRDRNNDGTVRKKRSDAGKTKK